LFIDAGQFPACTYVIFKQRFVSSACPGVDRPVCVVLNQRICVYLWATSPSDIKMSGAVRLQLQVRLHALQLQHRALDADLSVGIRKPSKLFMFSAVACSLASAAYTHSHTVQRRSCYDGRQCVLPDYREIKFVHARRSSFPVAADTAAFRSSSSSSRKVSSQRMRQSLARSG